MISFSQSGEDLIIKKAFEELGIKNPSYIDVGCHHPIFGNVTYLSYKNDSKGVVIEPNNKLCNIIQQKRSKDICINGGVGNNDGEDDYYSFKRDTRNTFSKQQADEWKSQSGQEYKIEKIKVYSLNSIINKYFYNKTPDLISLDTEGYEEKILSSFNWDYKPKIFCIESAGRKDVLNSLFIAKGYSVYAETPANTIFKLK
jgi:FkbM family methyltransferase